MAASCTLKVTWPAMQADQPSIDAATPDCPSDQRGPTAAALAHQLQTAGSCVLGSSQGGFFSGGPIELVPASGECIATISYAATNPAGAVVGYSSAYCGASGAIALAAILAALLARPGAAMTQNAPLVSNP